MMYEDDDVIGLMMMYDVNYPNPCVSRDDDDDDVGDDDDAPRNNRSKL